MIFASNSRRPQSDLTTASRRAFTLIELLVVMSIIVILVSISVPVLSKLSQSNKRTQARNMVAAYIANARSSAMQYRRSVAVVLYEQTPIYSDRSDPNQTAIILALANADQTPASAGNILFSPMPGRLPEMMPAGIKVAGLDDTSSIVRQNGSAGVSTRAIIFDGNGQLILRSGLSVNSPTGALGSASMIVGDWNFSGGSNSASTAGVILYDGQQFTAAAPANAASWLQQNADIVVVNAFTGNLNR